MHPQSGPHIPVPTFPLSTPPGILSHLINAKLLIWLDSHQVDMQLNH